MKNTTIRKRLLLVILSIMMVASLSLMSACGDKADKTDSTAPAGDTATPPAGDDTAAPPAEKVTLTLSMHDPIASSNGQFLQSWADEVSEKTNGGLTINIQGDAVLAASGEVGEAVEGGTVDIGWLYTGYYAGQFPLTDVTTVPLAGFGDPVVTTNTLWDLYEKTPELQAEWSNFKLLDLYGNPGMLFAGTEKKIETPADVKGLALRCPPQPLITEFVTELGGIAKPVAPPDIAEQINSNQIQGYIFEPAGIVNFSLQDMTKYFTDYPLYDAAFGLVMNQAKFDSLPAEYQAVLEETTQKAGSIKAAENFKASAEAAKATIADAGGEWLTVTDTAAWQAIADPIIAKWPATITLDGFDASAYLADAQSIAASYK
jgi:TRAP-type C4-dicarboxylate transport system substrate-binding protein